MSRIYFHSPSGEAEIRGAERAYAAGICNDLTMLVLAPELRSLGRGPAALREWLPDGCYVRDALESDLGPRGLAQTFSLWFNASGDRDVLTDPRTGDRYRPFDVALNTAIAMGSAPIRLLARLHGQCELHAWVDGPDREWLAGIIELGRRDNVLRPDMGWESVVELLRSRDDEPVVTSYSVCNQFPNAGVVAKAGLRSFTSDADYEAFDESPLDDQWSEAMTALHMLQDYWKLQLNPKTFDEQGFVDGRSAFDIVQAIRSEVTV